MHFGGWSQLGLLAGVGARLRKMCVGMDLIWTMSGLIFGASLAAVLGTSRAAGTAQNAIIVQPGGSW